MRGKSPEVESEQRKTCVDCGTSKTPLWRAGPAGPKSLCNACGIRSRKKRREVVGLNRGTAYDRKHRKWGNHNGSSNHSDNRGNQQVGDGLKQRLLALGRGVLMQRSTFERQRRKLGDEEEAAVLLMALSYA